MGERSIIYMKNDTCEENVMQIAICDDEQKELKVIRTALDTYREAHPEYSFDIDEYSTALDVLHAVEAFALNATHYLPKPLSQEQFDEAVDRAVKKTEERVFLSLACADGMHRVCISEIASVESQSHYLNIHLPSGEVLRLRMKLSEMFEESTRNFSRWAPLIL